MAGKKVKLRGIKRAPKTLESDLLEKSKTLWEDPSVIRPKCAGKCWRCPFDKTFSSIAKVKNKNCDADQLIKLASKGSDDIFKAYCATVAMHVSGTVPLLASAKIAGESVSYAQRGSVGNDKLIGMQYYNDPKMRLFLFNKIAKKKGLHIYSFGDEIVCSKNPNTPEDYIYDTFWDTPYEFKDDEIFCGHTASGMLVIRTKSNGTEVRICRDCAKDVSTLQFLISRIASNDPLDDFEVFVEHKYHAEGEEGKTQITGDALKKYAAGFTTDIGVINSVIKDKLGSLKSGDSATYIIGTKNYGSDLDAFLSDVKGTEIEMLALRSYLEKHPTSIISRTDKASEVLNCVWSDAHEVIASFTDQETADSFGDLSRMNAAQMVKEAHVRYISRDVISKLPVFTKPGKVTTYADAYAKAYRVGGADMLKETIAEMAPKDMKMRGMAAAFGDVASCEVVKCTPEEREFADFMRPFVSQLVEAEGEDYREKMNTLLTAMGCGEKV